MKNVIKFPVEEVKERVQAERAEKTAVQKAYKNRWVSGAALAGIVLSIMFVNGSEISTGPAQNYAGQSLAANGRVIASVDSTLRDTAWEHRLAKYLSKRAPRGVASRGSRSIDKVDQLAANFGRYLIQTAESQNGVLAIELPVGATTESFDYDGDQTDYASTSYKGKNFNQKKMVEFINKYKTILVSGVKDFEPTEGKLAFQKIKKENGQEVYKTYLVSDKAKLKLAVEFVLKDGRLAKLTGEPVRLASL